MMTFILGVSKQLEEHAERDAHGIDTRAAAQAFLRRHPASYPQALARPSLLPTFVNQIKGLPYTVIVNSQHRICTRRLGPVDAAWLAKALAACAPPPLNPCALHGCHRRVI